MLVLKRMHNDFTVVTTNHSTEFCTFAIETKITMNYLHFRALVFAKNNFNKTIPEMKLTKDDYNLLVLCTRELKGYVNCLEKCKLRDGIRHILSISRLGNQYMQFNQPWVLLKGSPEEKYFFLL